MGVGDGVVVGVRQGCWVETLVDKRIMHWMFECWMDLRYEIDFRMLVNNDTMSRSFFATPLQAFDRLLQC